MKRVLLLMTMLFALLQTTQAFSFRRAILSEPIAMDTVVVDSVFYDDVTIDSIAKHNIRLDTINYGIGVPGGPLSKRIGRTSRKIGRGFVRFLEKFSKIDTTYIEPQKYDYAFMIQNTNTQEVYRISDKGDRSVTFAPEWSYKIGPYFGWRWIFLGYTLDINHLDFSHDDSQRQEFDLSLYTNLFGIDLYYRKSGNDYKIRRLQLGNLDTRPMKDVEFNGFRSSVKGFNIYYILNHHKFSYPAAFSQSTVQRRSAGTPLLGFAYTDHKLSIDWTELQRLVEERLGPDAYEAPVDSNFRSLNVKYIDISLSGGYAYNWVFAKNWLLSISLSAALAYKHSYGDNTDPTLQTRKGFSFRNFGFDGIGRFGLVYNTMKWYFGVNSTLNMFNYNKSTFSLNTFFGNLNFYVGFNFGKKKES